MMKRIIQIFIAILFAMPVVSQTVEIVDVPAALPGQVNVTIKINGTLSQVGSLTLKIALDNNMLVYQTGQHTTTYPGTFLIAENNSVLTVAWFTDDILGDGTNITGDFVTLKFNYTGGFNAALDFISNCEIEDIEGVTLLSFINNPGSFIPGSIVPDLTNPDGKASIGTNTAIAGANVSVPLTITDDGGFIGVVSAIDLKVGFDASKLTFINLTNNTLGLTAEASNGVITISKFNLSPPLTAFPYTVDMNFTYNGGGLADLTFLPGSVINGSQGQGLITLFEAGWVNVDLTNAGKLTIAKVSSPGGHWENNPYPPYEPQFVPDPVEVPVTAKEFAGTLVGAIDLVIAFDEEKLDYTGYINGPLGTGWIVTQSDGLLHFQRIGVNGITLPDNIALFTLKFDYSNGVADITFESGTILNRPDGTFIPVNLFNGNVADFSTLNLTVFLEGLYNISGMMRKAQDATGDHFTGTIADQITVELHDATTYSTIVWSINEVNLNTDGTATVSVPRTYAGNYYLTIKHRNHIETVSAAPIDFSVATISYDFTNLASKAFGNNQKLLSDGKFGIFAGDVNGDGAITGAGDRSLINADIYNGVEGYVPADVNGDGSVTGPGDRAMTNANIYTGTEKVTP